MKRILALIPVLVLLMLANGWAQSPPQVTTDPRQAFISGSFVVKGEATADQNMPMGQRKLMALRGAKAVAFRELAEVLNGVVVAGETTVENMATQSDIVKTAVQGMVKGAQIVNESYDSLSGIATVYLAVPMRGENGLITQLLPQVIQSAPVAPAPAYVPTAPPAEVKNYDGLILDCREQPFKPALINRVLTKGGETIYDPAKVAQNILVDRGAAEYTNDIGKAKAILGERGTANPLVVKVSGVVKSTDVTVGPDDATSIFSSNQASNYLEGAKVVFVLK